MTANAAFKPDAIDERILDALREDPRMTSKSIATAVSLTEAAVAARIRTMEAKGAMRVVAQLDFRAVGYNVLAMVDITVANGMVRDVADALVKLEGVGSVSIMIGDPPIITQVQAANLEGLQNLILKDIATIPGIEQVETNVIINIAKWRPEYGELHPTSLLD